MTPEFKSLLGIAFLIAVIILGTLYVHQSDRACANERTYHPQSSTCTMSNEYRQYP